MKIKKRGKKDGKSVAITDFKNKTVHALETEQGVCDLTVVSLPVGFQQQLGRDLPIPEPPLAPVRIDGKVKKDHRGNMQLAPDKTDKKWKKKAEEMAFLHMIASVYWGLQEDEEIEFETKIENFKGPESGFDAIGFYRAVKEEMEKANFQTGTFIELSEKIFLVSGFSAERLKEIQSFFLMARLGN